MKKNKKYLWLYLLCIFLLPVVIFQYTAPLRMVGKYSPKENYYVYVAPKGNVLFVLQLAHVGYPNDELLLFDVSMPDKPALISKLEFVDGNDAYGITVNGDYLYIASYANILVVDISNIKSPKLVATFASPEDSSYSSPLITDNNNIGYIETLLIKGGQYIPFLSIVSLENPRAIKQLSLTPEFGAPLWLAGDYLFIQVAKHSRDYLGILDVSNPEKPKLAKEMPDLKDLTDVFGNGSILYFSSRDNFVVADISNPMAPIIQQYPGRVGDRVIVDGKTAFFIKERFFIYAADFSDSKIANVIFVDRINQGVDFTKVGDYIYVADKFEGLLIYKINRSIPAWRNPIMTFAYNVQSWISEKVAIIVPP